MSEQLNVDNRATVYNSINQHIDDSGFLPIQEIKTADISRVLTKETLQTQSSTSLTLTNSTSNNSPSFEDDEEDNTSLFEFLYDETTEGDNTNNNSGSGGELLSLPLNTLELPVTPPVDEQEQQLKQQAAAPQVQSGLLPIETCAATLLTPYSTAVSLSASSSDITLSNNNNLNSSNYSSSNSLALSTAAAIAQSSSAVSSAILPGNIINSNNLLNLSDIPTSLSPTDPKNNKISPKKKGRTRSNSKSSGKKKSPKKKAAKKKAAPTTTKKPLRRPRTVTISNSVGSLMQPIINNNNNMDNQEGSPDDVAPPQVTSGIAPATHAVAAQQGLYHPPRSAAQTSASNTISTLSPATGNIENTGRWTAEEHRLFLQGLEQHGKGWKKIATLIKSRTVVQIRTHAQKYFQKLAKARQNGEAVPVQQGVGGVGQHQVQVSAQVNNHHHHAPLGVDGQPVVTMRTTTNPISSQYPGTTQNMALGNDPASLAAAAGNINISTTGAPYQARGRKRRSNAVPGGTKRRVIGNVVRSAVREGRNVKRQKIAEAKRNAEGTEATASAPASLPTIKEDVSGKFEVPNPLPAVSQVLGPYVVTTEMAPPPANATGVANPKNQVVRGRQQLVNTATHGTLPMAALEDAVFRLLTPAGGGPAPGQGQANGTVVNPLAPQAKIAVNHTQYGHPSSSGNPTPPTTVTTTVGTAGNPSPTGVADMLLPGWVDTNNPPQWYADGGDIDTLLEDAEALNWLSDTGDLNETYPPAMVEPTAVSSSSSTAVPSIASIEPNPVGAVTAPQQQDPTGGVVHPSADSLSFLMDPPESQPQPPAVAAVPPKQLPTFLEDPPAPVEQPPTSATEALMADNTSSATEGIPKLAGVGESVTNLMGFPDVDMGDEQAFVSALLDNRGQSTMSFPKLSSEMALNSHVSEDKTEEK